MKSKPKKTKVEKQPDGKIKLSKYDSAGFASLVGKTPENIAKNQSDLGELLKAICEEFGWLDENGKIA